MPRASCETVRESISAALDGQASDIDVVAARRHLDRCAQCRRFEQDVVALARDLRESERLQPTPLALEPRARPGRWRRPLSGIATAAALVAAALLGALTSEYRTEPPPPTTVPADVRVALLGLHALRAAPGSLGRTDRYHRLDVVRLR